MPPFSLASKLCALGAASACALGCGAELDPPSELNSLRVIAVQKDKPYAKPGDTVTLTMLFDDATPEAGRPIDVGWLSGCFDPPGDLYSTCFAGGVDPLAVHGDSGPDHTTFSFTLPDDIITRRPPSPDPRQPPYGLAYVFFAACAGVLTFDVTGASEFPLVCLDDQGTPLGSRDFVAGYSGVYVFDEFTNENPIVTGFAFNGADVDPAFACVGPTCLAQGPAVDEIPAELTIRSCPDDGDPVLCKGFPLHPLVDPASAEDDTVTAVAYGHDYQEQLWISYYATGGATVKSTTRLLNDATTGWNPNFGTELYAPKDPGPVRVIAAVHDNRGGVAWSGTTILVQ